jgi:hypothetical protein
MGFELATLVVIDTDWTGSCKSNYHAIMTEMSTKKKRVHNISNRRKCKLKYYHIQQELQISNSKSQKATHLSGNLVMAWVLLFFHHHFSAICMSSTRFTTWSPQPLKLYCKWRSIYPIFLTTGTVSVSCIYIYINTWMYCKIDNIILHIKNDCKFAMMCFIF